MLLNEFFQKPSLLEGGNIFKGDLATIRINQADVLPTVVWLEKYTGLPLQDNMLGTTGRKDTSGDLDLGVDNKSITKEQLVAKLGEVAKAMGVDPRDIIKKSGISVHFRTPIAGDPNKGYVQTDFMFTDDTEWTKFAAAASGTSTYKGAHKHVVMSSIAASMNLKWSPTLGLVTRDTGNVLSKDPDHIAEILLGKGHDRSDLASVESILDAIKNDPERDEKLMAARETLAKEGVTLPEAKQLPGPAGQVKGMDRARTVKPRPFAGSQPHPFQGKLVGSESVREETNPTDKVSMDIPLLIRIMEYAREDAQTDMDLHNVAEKLIALSKEGLTLGMDSYDAIVDNEQPVDEDIVEEGLLGKAAGLIGAYYGVQLGVPDAVMQTMDMPFGTYEIVKHLLGAGVGYVAGNAVGDAAVSGTKKLIAKMLWTGIQKTIQSIKGGKPKEQAWKDYETEIAALYEKIKQKQAAEKINNKFEPVVTRKTNEAVWDEPNPKKNHEKLSPAWKAKAKARASAAGRAYPNAVDNIWAAKQQK